MRKVLFFVVVLAGFASLGGTSHAGLLAPHGTVRVYFTDGEDVMDYARAGAPRTLKGALHALLRGPTAAERRDDVRTWIPHGTRLISVHHRGHVVTVDLGRRFLRGHSRDSLRARVVEVVYTATQFRHEHRVRLLVDRHAVRLEDGVAPSRFLTRHDVDPPKRGLLTPTSYVKDRQGPDTGKTKRLQSKLIELGYLPEGSATGHYGPQTTQAVMAFQGWEGLDRDGDAGPKTYRALRTATRPEPKTGSGKRALVYLKRQVLLLVRGSRTVRAIHISSGAPGTSTPPGRFRIYRKARKDWSYPFKVWLQYASYFTGGIAFHEYPDVPPYPASHGCVRVPRDDSKTVYEFTKLGTPVSVLRS